MLLFNVLDLLWKNLVVFTLSSSVLVITFFLIQSLVRRKISQASLRNLFNFNSLLIFAMISFGILVIGIYDIEVISNCINSLAKKSSGSFFARTLSGIYLISLFVLTGKNLYSYVRLKNKHKSLEVLKDSKIIDLIKNLMQTLNIKNEIKLKIDPSISTPYVKGIFSYELVLNSYMLNQQTSDSAKAILCHELIHIKRDDTFWLAVSYLLSIIFFYNPLFLIFHKLHRHQIELAADEGAIDNFHLNPAQLRNAIIEVMEFSYLEKISNFHVGAARGFNELKDRLVAMKANIAMEKKWIFPVLCCVCAICFVLTFSLQTKASLSKKEDNIFSEVLMSKLIEQSNFFDELFVKRKIENQCGR